MCHIYIFYYKVSLFLFVLNLLKIEKYIINNNLFTDCLTAFIQRIQSMPYLQLDVNKHYSVEDKKRLAAKMSETYARMMSVDIRRISIAIRELGEGSIWRVTTTGEEPVPVAVMMLDIRKGRSPELRMDVAKALCKHCIEILGLEENRLNVEFTQHSGNEMYHPALGGYSPEWQPGEQ